MRAQTWQAFAPSIASRVDRRSERRQRLDLAERRITRFALNTTVDADSSPKTAALPLLSGERTYSHVSPGVCDACETSRDARAAWVELLLGQFPSHVANAERTRTFLNADAGYTDKYRVFEKLYEEYLLAAIESDTGVASTSGKGDTLMDMVEEKERLLRSCGLEDMFLGLKSNENEICLALYPEMCKAIDNAADSRAKLKLVVEAALAGNLFDAGAAAAVQNVAFCDEEQAQCDFPEESKRFNLDASQLFATFAKAQEKVLRPSTGWKFDSFEQIDARLHDAPWKRVLIFCDNAGADTMGMVLLARYLSSNSADTSVALVANSTAALNDITYDELSRFVSNCAKSDADLRSLVDAGRITCLPSGATSTLLDFTRVSTELESYVRCANTANEDWLVVLDGMGRSLESNWNAASYMSTGVDVLTLAMVKSEINAKRLGAEVYDCVVRLNTAP
jgi:uncharacterized protein with ATP-grasp and redox domains/uncharacterized protein YozE (UPF0346 family)